MPYLRAHFITGTHHRPRTELFLENTIRLSREQPARGISTTAQLTISARKSVINATTSYARDDFIDDMPARAGSNIDGRQNFKKLPPSSRRFPLASGVNISFTGVNECATTRFYFASTQQMKLPPYTGRRRWPRDSRRDICRPADGDEMAGWSPPNIPAFPGGLYQVVVSSAMMIYAISVRAPPRFRRRVDTSTAHNIPTWSAMPRSPLCITRFYFFALT